MLQLRETEKQEIEYETYICCPGKRTRLRFSMQKLYTEGDRFPFVPQAFKGGFRVLKTHPVLHIMH